MNSYNTNISSIVHKGHFHGYDSGATSDWERMLVSSGSSPSKLLVKVVDLVVTVVLVVKGSVLEGPEGWCCRMEKRAAHVAALILLRRDMKSRGGNSKNVIFSIGPKIYSELSNMLT